MRMPNRERLCSAFGERNPEGLDRENVVARLSLNLTMCRLDCASEVSVHMRAVAIRKVPIGRIL